MADDESWLIAEVPGPRKAAVIRKPEAANAMIRRARCPVLVIGHIAAETDLEGRKLIDYLIELARKGRVPVVATAHTRAALKERGFEPFMVMPAVSIGARLTDPDWQGCDDAGPYDLALFAGLPYQMTWTILSGLKHFAPHLRTMSLDNVYQPNASWSFPNLSIKDWITNLGTIVRNLER
jgi:acetyl-CoA decarbonylase/synthase complex subunit epsilon